MHFCTRRRGALYVPVERERAGDAARLAIDHVFSHCRQRHKVLTVMVLAMVSTRLPWQNGHAAGRGTSSLNRDSDILPWSFETAINAAVTKSVGTL